eukprot:jgi/Chlat1/1832/Chrsp14S02227
MADSLTGLHCIPVQSGMVNMEAMGEGDAATVTLAVNGTLMNGLELNYRMKAVHAKFIKESTTAPEYRLYSIGDKYPGMALADCGGAAIAVELWEVPIAGLPVLLSQEPPGLGMGLVTLADKTSCFGVLAEPDGKKTLILHCIKQDIDPRARFVHSEPYAWPYNGNLRPSNTVLLIIDMQYDFCAEGGYVSRMGYNLTNAKATIPKIAAVLQACRQRGFHIMHTREGHRPNTLNDLPANKQWRSRELGAGIGDADPHVRMLQGWDIIPELYPLDGEDVIEKPGKGSFYATDLDMLLQLKGIENIVLCGLTTDVCVHTTMRDANDRGYECLLLTDCCAATDPTNHAAACNMVTKQGGVFGAIASAEAFITTIHDPYFCGPIAVNSNEFKAMLAHGSELDPPQMANVATALPFEYDFPVAATAVLCINMQKEFLAEGGYGSTLGNDHTKLLPAVAKVHALQELARQYGLPVMHILEAHLPDLSDCPPSKLARGNRGQCIGDQGLLGRLLIRGEPGNSLVEECSALETEAVLYKPGKGAFFNSGLTELLELHGITHLIIAGVTTEVGCQTTLREANDRGYEALLVEDCTESYLPELKEVTLNMIRAQGAIVARTATLDCLRAALATTSQAQGDSNNILAAQSPPTICA